jgi:serine/threonine protein kinase/HEAT repeat protein
MSQETKGRTMIGTVAPVIQQPPPQQQRPTPSAGPQDPTIAPANAAPMMMPASAAPTIVPANAAPTIVPANAAPIPAGPAPTVGPRPGPAPSAGASLAGDDTDMFIGQDLCGYTIRRKLAEGGMGVVYEGMHGKIGRLGAIKVLKLEFCRSEDVVERFYQEARSVNSIRHENIVDIYDFGRDPYGRVFFVMEYLEGEPLSARIRRGALTWPEAFPILEQTLRALKAAHDKGFVHRDLKPDNIWLKYVDGRVQVKLLDFGIAKLVGSESPREKLTQTGSVIGTPHYMSPEQINGSKDIDQRTDIYALGVITYEMFAGVTPFVGDTLQAIMTGHLFKEPPRLADIPANLGVPAPIAELVDRMLVKDATGRYASVTDVLADLYDVNRNQWPANAETLNRLRPTRAPAAMERPAAPPRGSRNRGLVIGGVLAVAAIASVAVWQSQQGPRTASVVVTPGAGSAVDGPKPPPPEPPKPLDYPAVRKDAQATLRASLRETEPAVRVQGSDALGRIRDQPSVPALTDLTEKDPDAEVRGHAADALGTIGAPATAQLLAKLEAAAPPPLKVWYASALARLGDKAAGKRLLGYARSKDLAVSFKAGLTLADLSRPGDKQVIAALTALVVQEAKLNDLVPYAGALILTKLAALRDARARKILYTLLEDQHEGARLAAAEGLAKLGDDAGKTVLQDVFANQASPNRLVAAVAQIALGEYGGLALITAGLDDKAAATRRLAARALGEIGERKSLPALIALGSDKDWTVRISAAAAIVAIVGLDPQVLAQASVDWTKGALGSQDWAVRKAAAGVLADIPAKDAVPLLAQAILDKDPNVRREASKSAGKMKSAEAAAKVADAVKAETDPDVKEQQVKALGAIGAIGGAAAHDTLAQIAEEPGRIGVLAAGSLIAVGDASGKAKLEAAVAAPAVELRLAAVEAASTANNPIVVPTLKLGVADRVFSVRFTAALGLATFNAEKAAAVPVLTAALGVKDADVVGRAMAALTRFGERLKDTVRTPAELLDSPDPKLRLAAVAAVRALPSREAVPLLRRLVADPDQDVRHAGVDAIEDVATKDKDQAIKLYKPLVGDDDPVVRSKASGQLARLVPPPQKIAAVAPVPEPPATPAPPPPDDTLPRVQRAFDDATAAAAEAKTASEAFEALAADLATAIAAPEHDVKHVEELAKNLDEAAAKLETVAVKIEATAKAVSEVAGASPSLEAAKLVNDASALAQGTRDTATATRGKVAQAAKKARDFITSETDDGPMLLDAARVEIASGDLSGAKQNLAKAAKLIPRASAKRAILDDLYAQLYDKMAARTQDPAAKLQLLRQAEGAYSRVEKTGAGPSVQRAKDRRTEIADDIQSLGQP